MKLDSMQGTGDTLRSLPYLNSPLSCFKNIKDLSFSALNEVFGKHAA